jgi:hypothetical protein
MYGNRQTLPRPMAHPAETRIKPRRVENLLDSKKTPPYNGCEYSVFFYYKKNHEKAQ